MEEDIYKYKVAKRFGSFVTVFGKVATTDTSTMLAEYHSSFCPENSKSKVQDFTPLSISY